MILNHPSGFVTTPTFRIAIPEVIVLRHYDKMPVGEVKFTRRNIYEHYSYRCCYCGHKYQYARSESGGHVLHEVPAAAKPIGRTSGSRPSVPCNLRKADKLPEEANMKLLIRAVKTQMARQRVLGAPVTRVKMKASWQRFIGYRVYWNTELEP